MRKIATGLLLFVITAGATHVHAGFFDAFAGALQWTADLAVTLAEKQPRLKEIYTDHFGAAGPTGTLHPTLTISPGGEVTSVKIDADTIGDVAFAEKIRQEVLTWDMPDSTASMELGFDLEFDPGRNLYGVDAQVEK